MIKLILWLSIGWLPILVYLMHRSETRFKKNIVIGVTLPFTARTDPEVLDLLKRFLRRSLFINLVMLLLSFLPFVARGTPLMMSLWMTWMILAIVIPNIPYVRANLQLKRLKEERGWKRTRGPMQYLDLSALPSARQMSPWVFVPAVLLAFIPLLWDKDMLYLYITFGVSTLLFWFCYRYLYRNKSEMVDQNAQLTRALTQVRRHNWGIGWIISAYGFAGLSLIFFLFQAQPLLQMIAALLVVFLICIFIIRVEFITRRVQEKLTRDSGRDWYVDDDDYWLYGQFYYNPNDSKLLVNSRTGVNSTINLARTSGKMIASFIALIMLALPFTGAFLGIVENQPLSLELSGSCLLVRRGNKTESLDRSSITEVQLLPELPQNMHRNWGNAMDKLWSGNFSIKGTGSVQVSLDPTIPPFLLISLSDGSHHLVGSRQPAQTEAVYQQLR